MLEIFVVLVILLVAGIVIGAGVLLHRENQTVQRFFANRPVLAWPTALLIGGSLVYAVGFMVLYILLFLALLIAR